MRDVLESRAPEGARVSDLAGQRSLLGMRRRTWRLRRAKVQVSDVNGPRGGVDKRCQVELKTDGNGTVVITSLARDWRSALDSALARAARVLVRLLRRGQAHERARPRAIASDL